MDWGWQTDHEGVFNVPLAHFQDDSSKDVEALAVADGRVPARVSEQHLLQQSLVLFCVFAREQLATSPVQVLPWKDRLSDYCFLDTFPLLDTHVAVQTA